MDCVLTSSASPSPTFLPLIPKKPDVSVGKNLIWVSYVALLFYPADPSGTPSQPVKALCSHQHHITPFSLL